MYISLSLSAPTTYIHNPQSFRKGNTHARIFPNNKLTKGSHLEIMMQELLRKNSESNNLSLKMGSLTPHHQHQNTKQQLGFQFQFQDQDSSSTSQTTSCQSYTTEVASAAAAAAGDTYNFGEDKFSIHSAHGTHEDGSVGSALPIGTQDYGFASQPDNRQPYGCIQLPYYTGLLASYGHMSQTMIPHFQGMNITSTRVPLPLDFAQDEPIYVNAKQYNAILRRREHRAKLEAQNKVSKQRKPYLHESRHFHAIKRARGPGGRFLNLKKIQETQRNGPSDEQEDGHNSGSGGVCSDITTASNVDNLFHQQEPKFSIYNPQVGGAMLDGTRRMFG